MNITALITGSSGGIGLELAKVCAKNGDNLVLVARSRDLLDKLKLELEDKFKVNVYTIGKDLAVPAAAGEVYDELSEKKITIDYLINNAGLGDVGLFAESDWDKQEKMINLNITSLVHLTRLFLPDMILRGRGKILNVASTSAFQPGPTMSVYFASKAFVLSFSEAVNNEVRDRGITVTALCPGSTKSGFHEAAIDKRKVLKERKMQSSYEVAEFGYKAMMKGKSVAIPGTKNSLMAFLVRFLPREFVVRAARRIQENKF